MFKIGTNILHFIDPPEQCNRFHQSTFPAAGFTNKNSQWPDIFDENIFDGAQISDMNGFFHGILFEQEKTVVNFFFLKIQMQVTEYRDNELFENFE